ncbi:MAG TPA: glutathionylspermidine synthase family protein [Capsulimonadaceae bacterium]|jgi:glutathionylspermidine synthase
MERITLQPRLDWQDKVSNLGLVFHTTDGEPYWNESAFYRFSAAEIDVLEKATNDLHEMCLAAVEHVVERNRLGELGIPEAAWPAFRHSWEHDDHSVYGRFDLAYDGMHAPKMLEYNADTPTALVEAAVAQWFWLKDRFPMADQFNSVWEALIARWRSLREQGRITADIIHFAHESLAEDIATVTALQDTAQQAGFATSTLRVEEIGWDTSAHRFVGLNAEPIRALFKLYPWEWMLQESFAPYALEAYETLTWIEPLWKLALSSKGILPILWELNLGHPNLLECYSKGPHGMAHYAEKPLFSREGSNVTLRMPDGITQTDGIYGDQSRIYQAIAPIAKFGGIHAVIGSWVIGNEACGIGIRESDTPITDDRSRFVPHIFE